MVTNSLSLCIACVAFSLDFFDINPIQLLYNSNTTPIKYLTYTGLLLYLQYIFIEQLSYNATTNH